MAKRIAIIGGGSSGLTAVKTCLEEGFVPVCFERYSDIGGIWYYNDGVEQGRASVYKSCVINTSKEMMAYSDFPMPVEFPPFIPHHMLLKYLRMYVEHFKLLPYIRFNTTVKNITKSPDYDSTGRWIVQFTNDVGSKEELFDGVMVCTGHHHIPHMPTFKGQKVFTGLSFHSQQYRTPECFRNKRVLVIGKLVFNCSLKMLHKLCRFFSDSRKARQTNVVTCSHSLKKWLPHLLWDYFV